VRPWLRHVPNVISSLRILLVIPIALALLHRQLLTTMGLFFVAAVSDAADGFLAKRFKWQSALGGVLDPAADKLLLATVFIVLTVLHLVPSWLMVTAVARDLVIVLGALAYRVFLGPVEAHPSTVSKANTLCQAAYILGVIAREEIGIRPEWWLLTLGALTFVTTVVSGVDYVLRYTQAAVEESRARRARAAAAAGLRAP
jgi:cardiolipin synthase